ncbi:MAG: hypothetical protein QOJ41_2871, partial [Acidobacteriaceae bacterium]|nr:hypothetical protein [Acidobacteriaceae bacterium]
LSEKNDIAAVLAFAGHEFSDKKDSR